MVKDDIVRINICFPKDDTTTLQMIDDARGNQPRSQAIHRMIEYLCKSDVNTLKGIIATRHKPEVVHIAY